MADENVTQENDETPIEEPVAEAPVVDDVVTEADEAPSTPDEAATEESEPVPAVVAEEPEAAASAEAEPPAPPEPPAEAKPAEEAVPAPQSGPKPKRKHVPRPERRQRPKTKRVPATERKAIVRLPKPEDERGRRQERQGTVVSSAMDKTIVVRVEMTKSHRKYKKVVRRSVKFHAHDEQNQANVGDVVRIIETRPLSATKHWRLAEIVEAAK